MLRTTLVLSGAMAFALFACSSDDDSGNAGGSGGARAGSGGSMAGSGGSSAGSGGSAAAGSGSSTAGAGGSATAGAGGAMGGAGGAMGGAGGAMGGAGGAMGGAGGAMGDAGPGDAGNDTTMSFFVTSEPAGNGGNLGGLEGADAKCKALATTVSAEVGAKNWRAYLSVAEGPNNAPVHAKDRIGTGPWYNSKGMLVAQDVAELHEKNGDYMLFLDEKGQSINGQWPNSPDPNQHDIMTGTNRDGTVNMGRTCDDWTSNTATPGPWVGHSDGLGPGGSMAANYRPWNGVHGANACSANGVGSGGGNGRIYCFAAN